MSNAVAKIDFSESELAVIRKQFFPAGGSPAEQAYCLAVARELGLNPITKEIYFVPRRQKVNNQWVDKIEPMVGRDGFLAIAHKSTQMAGMESTATIHEVPQLVGRKWEYRQDLIAECKVWRKDSDKPYSVQVSYTEYCQKNSDGQPTKFWAEKPETMLKKVAESQALRKAFNIHGVYCPEELGAGFETAGGDVVMSPAIDAEFSRVEARADVPPPSPPHPAHDPDADDVWPPVGPTPRPPEPPPSRGTTGVETTLEGISSMLTAKGIKHEVDDECGYIAAKAFAHKDYLKGLGFRWEPEIKSWVWTALREAA